MSQIYDDCVIQAPDGVILARTRKKRVLWYMDRNLAVKLCDNPLTIRLNFEPKARFNLKEASIAKENICVCCGTAEKLDRHHIIPCCFRNAMPVEWRASKALYHDVVALCNVCHSKYESHAQKLKNELCKKFGITTHGYGVIINKGMSKVVSYAKTLLKIEKVKPPIPEYKKQIMLDFIRDFFGKEPDNLNEISKMQSTIKTKDYIPFGKYIIDRVNLVEFTLMWRQHFLNYLQPKHLPSWWDATAIPNQESDEYYKHIQEMDKH